MIILKLIQKIYCSKFLKFESQISIIILFSVIGPVITVSGGFWDAISHLLNEPEFFWSPSHIIVYFGVSLTGFGAFLGSVQFFKKSLSKGYKTGMYLITFGAILQLVSGFADSLSHDLFGIDGLISWSHQPLELGLVLGSLGGLLLLKNREKSRLRILIPFSIITFLFFLIWLGFNLILIFGHIIQCIPVYQIFSSGCAVL